jgi:DNA (cytosine-5)-methyltransferase 1
MNYLSVCSGIEAATVAWHHMGWNPVAFSEIEKFPSEVLKHHYPHVPNLGDMTKYKEWNLNAPIDILVGGTPCQSFSVAGLRKGLEDPRGNLALTYVGILDKFRPKWFVWENVPGVLSSNGGKDFGSFLSALVELGYGWSYRVLNAQYFGVAQRRRRVFVVGHFGNWRNSAEVLFESESLSRNIKKSNDKEKETSKYAGRGIASICPTIGCELAKQVNNQMVKKAEAFYIPETIALAENTIGRQPHNGGNGDGFTKDGPMYTLNATGVHGIAYGFQANARPDEMNFLNNISTTLTVGQRSACYEKMAVRRLTPIECERLQGFSDNYTNIKDNCPDGPRYKALGNSMAVPVMKWIGERINANKST